VQTKLKLGTRGSALALAQARMTAEALAAARGWEPDEAAARIETVIVKTTGDKVTDRPLADIGGKGLFAKELEEALFDGRIDIAVHSAKDLPSFLPPGLTVAGALTRADPRDAFLSPKAKSIAGLPQGAVVGSSSVRRQAQLLAQRPDLKIIMYRGNVDTRLAKLAAGEVDATILAAAGLARLGRLHEATAILAPDQMLPAAAQGIVAFETREDDAASRAACAAITDPVSHLALTIERAVLQVLDGSCKTPLAALAQRGEGGMFTVHAGAWSPDGKRHYGVQHEFYAAQQSEAQAFGEQAGRDLLARCGRGFLQA
jgi:hydroxymethylbilane synthase